MKIKIFIVLLTAIIILGAAVFYSYALIQNNKIQAVKALMNKTVNRYGSATSYCDSGQIETYRLGGRIPFTTKLMKPDLYYLAEGGVVTQGKVFVYGSLSSCTVFVERKPREYSYYKEYPSLNSLLFGCNLVLREFLTVIPFLFHGNSIVKNHFLTIAEYLPLREVTFKGQVCYRIDLVIHNLAERHSFFIRKSDLTVVCYKFSRERNALPMPKRLYLMVFSPDSYYNDNCTIEYNEVSFNRSFSRQEFFPTLSFIAETPLEGKH